MAMHHPDEPLPPCIQKVIDDAMAKCKEWEKSPLRVPLEECMRRRLESARQLNEIINRRRK